MTPIIRLLSLALFAALIVIAYFSFDRSEGVGEKNFPPHSVQQ